MVKITYDTTTQRTRDKKKVEKIESTNWSEKINNDLKEKYLSERRQELDSIKKRIVQLEREISEVDTERHKEETPLSRAFKRKHQKLIHVTNDERSRK